MARFIHWRRVLNAWFAQLSLWWHYDRSRSQRYRPLLRAEFAEGDIISEAKFLHSAGYYKAAACLSRVAVEYRLYRFALVLPNWRRYRNRGIAHMAQALHVASVIRQEDLRLFSKFAAKVNRHCHLTLSTQETAGSMIDAADRCLARLDLMAHDALRIGWDMKSPPLPYDKLPVGVEDQRLAKAAELSEQLALESEVCHV